MQNYSLPETNHYYVYKGSFKIQIEEGRTVGGTFKYCSDMIYHWIVDKFKNMHLPESIRTIQKELFPKRVEVIYQPEDVYFCMRTSHQDNSDPTRFWVTEAEIIQFENNLWIAIRNSYSAQELNISLNRSGIPKFAKRLNRKCKLLDANCQTGTVKYISTDDDLALLFDVITDKSRLLPVVVISQYKNTERHGETLAYLSEGDTYLVDGSKLAIDLQLRAHVFCLPIEFQAKWIEIVEKEWAVYDGAIRTYYPGISFGEDECYKHPLTLAKSILAMEYTSNTGKVCLGGEAFRIILRSRIGTFNACARVRWEERGNKFYITAFREQFHKKVIDSSEKEYYVALEEENNLLREQLTEQKKQIESYEKDLDQTQSEIKKYVSINYATQERIRNLEKKLEELGEQKYVTEYPTEYDKVADWVEQNFAGRIEMSTRAKRSLKKAEYSDITLVCKALELLATDYYDMRLGNGSQEYNNKREYLNLEDAPSISDISAGEQGEEYYINYNGQRKKLDRHLRKGTGRDPRECLRIYYFWDDERSVVVVGSLPYHLSIRSSN